MKEVKQPVENVATDRRAVLKGTAAILASGIFPAVHAQEKIVLRYLARRSTKTKKLRKNSKKPPASKFNTWL